MKQREQRAYAELPFEPDPDIQRDRAHCGQQRVERGLAELARDLARNIVVSVEPEVVIFGLQRLDDIVGRLLRGFLVGRDLVGQAHTDRNLVVFAEALNHRVAIAERCDLISQIAHGSFCGLREGRANFETAGEIDAVVEPLGEDQRPARRDQQHADRKEGHAPLEEGDIGVVRDEFEQFHLSRLLTARCLWAWTCAASRRPTSGSA